MNEKLTKVKETTEEKLTKVKENTEEKIKKGIQKTRELKFYLFKFACRVAVFIAILVVYIWDKNWLERVMSQPLTHGFNLIHFVWLFFMGMMIGHLVPNNRLTMAWKKAKESEYRPVENYDELELLKFVQKQNLGAWKVMLVWLCGNAVVGALYLLDILKSSDLLMLSVFYFLCDYICILFFCPFQKVLMKNKCCVNCRIYDWGHFMMFTPMLFIKNFYSWSLFFTSLVVLINWEIAYSKHPERFWEGSNATLKCQNCKERTCQVKRKLSQSK